MIAEMEIGTMVEMEEPEVESAAQITIESIHRITIGIRPATVKADPDAPWLSNSVVWTLSAAEAKMVIAALQTAVVFAG